MAKGAGENKGSKRPNLYNPVGGYERCYNLISKEIGGYIEERNANQLKIMQFSRLGVMISYGFPRPLAVKLFQLAANGLSTIADTEAANLND